MKNRLLVLTTSVVLAIPALCTAQRKGFVIGGSVAYGINQLETSFSTIWAHYTNKDGNYYSLVLNAGYMFNNHVGIISGLGMSWHSWSDNTDNFDVYEYRCTTRYINLPLYVHAVSSKHGKIGAFCNLGFEFGHLSGYTFLRDTGIYQQSVQAEFNKFAVTPFANTGVTIPIGKRIEITTGPKVQYQLTHLFHGLVHKQFAYSLQAGVLARL